MSRRRWGAYYFGVAVLISLGFTMVTTRAVATIDGVSPDSLTVNAGDSGGARVSVTSAEGSCLTATATAPGIEIGVNPGCAAAGTPVFSLTVIVEPDVPAGDYQIALREFDAARDQLLDTSELLLRVDSDTTTTTTTTTSTTAPPATTTSTTAATTTTASTTTSTTTSTTSTTTSTTVAPEPGATVAPVATAPPTTVPPTSVVETPPTTEPPEVVVQPAVETGLSPFLTVLAFLVLGTLVWMILRVQGNKARVRYRGLVDPERVAVIHRTFRDAGQGAPAAVRAAGASSSRLDVGIEPLSGPDAPVDVELLVGAPWSRQRARIVASKADGALQLQVQRGEAGLADVPDGEAAAQTWLDGLAQDLEAYGDGRGAAAIRRWLQP